MGYESKIIVVNRREHEGINPWIFAEEIARFDLSKMGYEKFDNMKFTDLFSIPIDFDLSVNNEDSNTIYPAEYWREDLYGEHCKYTSDLDSVINWLEKSEAKEHYRRAKLFLDFLRTLKDNAKEFDQICLVHYGY